MKVLRKSKSVENIVPTTLLSIGYYDIDYSITLNDDDIKKFKIEDITSLSTYQDFYFILENKYLWNKIQIDTANKNINLLLYMNKVGSEFTKAYVEYIAYEKPIFLNKEIELMVKTVNDFNFFFVNSIPLFPDKKKYFTLKVIYKDKEAIFNLSGEEKSDENQNNIKKNENDVPKNEQNQNDENKEKPINEENKNNGENNKKNILQNKDNIFNRISLDCEQYDFFICTIQDSVSIKNYQDFIEFLTYIKLNFGTLIAIEYNNFCEYFVDKESMTLLNKIYLLTDIFLLDNKDTIANFKKHYETFGNEKEKKKDDLEEKKAENQNKENENIEEEKTYRPLKPENILEKVDNKQINQIENKKSQKNIPKINVKNKNKDKFENNEKELFDYFKRKIACNGALSILNTKLGIFIDNNFSKITFIEVPMNTKALILSYDIKPYPKLTHTTVDLVDFYKTTLKKNREYYKSIFYGGLFHKIIQSKKKNFGLEILYPSYLIGHEILKRILNLNIKNMPLPENPNFYIVKLNLNEIKDYIKQSYLDKKESKFVLDCTNLESSRLKNYVPLFDGNLHEFFDNKVVKRDLIKKGFVNSKGFVNYDPVYRNGMGVPKIKHNKSNSNFEYNYVKKQVDTNIKNLRMRILNGNEATKVKLPILQCKVTEKINNYNKYSKKCAHKDYDKKCKYCILAQKALIERDIEFHKMKKMQLRSYENI